MGIDIDENEADLRSQLQQRLAVEIRPLDSTVEATYRTVTVDAARQRWYNGVSAKKQAALIPGRLVRQLGAMLESDPDGAKLEKNRMQLFRSVQAFLDEPAPQVAD